MNLDEIFEAWYRAHIEVSKQESFEELEKFNKDKENKGKKFDRKQWLDQRIKVSRFFIFVPSLGICPERFKT